MLKVNNNLIDKKFLIVTSVAAVAFVAVMSMLIALLIQSRSNAAKLSNIEGKIFGLDMEVKDIEIRNIALQGSDLDRSSEERISELCGPTTVQVPLLNTPVEHALQIVERGKVPDTTGASVDTAQLSKVPNASVKPNGEDKEQVTTSGAGVDGSATSKGIYTVQQSITDAYSLKSGSKKQVPNPGAAKLNTSVTLNGKREEYTITSGAGVDGSATSKGIYTVQQSITDAYSLKSGSEQPLPVITISSSLVPNSEQQVQNDDTLVNPDTNLNQSSTAPLAQEEFSNGL
ncbi:hypothetical protein [Neorickettsia helminthoeca]|nr:hypothetical protein [Neorickettsia helminthoeca]